MKKIFIIISTLVFSLHISAQKEIKAKVDSIQQDVERESFLTHTVEFYSMLAAIGGQTTTLKFYYISWQRYAEKDPYAMDARLVKLEVTYHIAVSIVFTQEYIFNRDETLMYYMYKEENNYQPDSSKILSYYFDKGELILLEKVFEDNNKGRKIQTLGLDDKEASRVDIINRKAKKYLATFKDLLEIEQIK